MNRAPKILLLAALSLCIATAAGAQGNETLRQLDARSFNRLFDNRQVKCTITLRSGNDPAAEGHTTLQIDLDSLLDGAAGGGLAKAGIVNGLLIVALPPGVETDGKPRLYYYDSAQKDYEYMYSKPFPEIKPLEGAATAIQDALSNDRERITNGLFSITRALQPGANPKGPTDPRLTGSDQDYALYGISWLVPCNVSMKEVVDLYNPTGGLEQGARLRLSVPLKMSAGASLPLAVFSGGLSGAVVRQQLPSDALPANAIPLVPAADLPPQAPQAGMKGQTVGSGAADNGIAPIIPVLLYSYSWVSWEAQIDLATLFHLKPSPETSTKFDGGKFDQPSGQQPLEPSTTPTLNPTAGASPELQEMDLNTALDEGSTKPAASKPTAATESAPANTPPADSSTGESAAPTPATSDSSSHDQSSGKEVSPGTLPEQSQVFHVPLKAITQTSAAVTYPPAAAGGAPAPQAQPGLPPPGSSAPADLTAMVLVPAGKFTMGSPGAGVEDADETPQGQVDVAAYYIDKYPVTNRQFYNFVLTAAYKPEGNWDKYYSPATADLPVRGVSWNDAAAFAKWAGKRLPTEAEWEKAARGTDGRTYPWGEDWSADILPRGDFNYYVIAAPKAASPFGVMAMSGTVWQWTASWYAPYPYNPKATGDKRVLRGGCFSNGRSIVRAANRYAESPNVALNTFGFRCAKDAK